MDGNWCTGIICCIKIDRYLWRSPSMEYATKWACYIFFFYECAEVSAITAVYVCDDRLCTYFFSVGKKYKWQVSKSDFGVWQSSFLLLYPALLYPAYHFYYFIFIKRS